MKILTTSNLSYSQNNFNFLARNQHLYDVLCINGHINFVNSSKTPIGRRVKWVNKWLNKITKPIFITSNAYIEHSIWKLSKKIYTDNQIIDIDGIKFGIMSVFGENEYNDFAQCDVIITNDAPSETLTSMTNVAKYTIIKDSWANKIKHLFIKQSILLQNKRFSCFVETDVGDKNLNHIIKNGLIKPKYLFCSMPETPKQRIDKLENTLIINTGYQSIIGNKPDFKIVEVE